MYFDRYSITSLRYIDISFKNLLICKPRGRSVIYLRFQFRPVLFVQPVFQSVSIFFCYLPDIRRSDFFTLPFGWECKGKDLF